MPNILEEFTAILSDDFEQGGGKPQPMSEGGTIRSAILYFRLRASPKTPQNNTVGQCYVFPRFLLPRQPSGFCSSAGYRDHRHSTRLPPSALELHATSKAPPSDAAGRPADRDTGSPELKLAPGSALDSSQLLHLVQSGSSLVLDDGTAVVTKVHGALRQSSRVLDGKGLVLGLHSSKGLTSRMDCVLGQVRCWLPASGGSARPV